MKNGKNYSRVFNRMCHVVALTTKLSEAIDELVLNILALDPTLNAKSVRNIIDAIDSYFGIPLSFKDVEASIERHLINKVLIQSDNKIIIPNKKRSEILDQFEIANQLEETVKEAWLEEADEILELDDDKWKEPMWQCLSIYMAKAFHQHGAKTIQLLKPDIEISEEDDENLFAHLRSAHKEAKLLVNIDKVAEAIQIFFTNQNSNRTKYILQLLDGTFTYFALNIDDVTSNYLKGSIPNVSIFLDTNFMFGVLGLHDSKQNDISKELVDVISQHDFPFTLYYHVETLDEMQRTLEYYGDKIRNKSWSQHISKRAINVPAISGIERKYHKQNSERPTDPNTFLTQFEQVGNLLNDYKFKIYRPTHLRINKQERYDIMAQYDEYRQRRGANKKSYERKEHDILLWQTVRANRNPSKYGLDAGAFFLTIDYYFYNFDRHELRRGNEICTTILPNQLLQLLRPFMSFATSTEHKFIETFALPEFRVSNIDYSDTYSKVLSYMNAYPDITEETALKILTNETAIKEFSELDEDSEEFKIKFEVFLAHENQELVLEKERIEKKLKDKEKQAQVKDSEISDLEERLKRIEKEREDEKKLLIEQQSIKLSQLEDKLDKEEREKKQTIALAKQVEARLRQQNKRNIVISITIFFGFLGELLIFIVPNFINWAWFNQHPNKWSLYVVASIIWLGLLWAYLDSKHWREIVIGVILTTLTIIVAPNIFPM